MRLFVPTASIRNISSLVCTRNSLSPFGTYDGDDDRMIMMTISLMVIIMMMKVMMIIAISTLT